MERRQASLDLASGTTVEERSSPLGVSRRAVDLLPIAAAAALAGGFALRLLHRDAPLWLDETFTGAIAAEPTLGAVLYQVLQDINAPLYYVLAHGWASVFGVSNAALRFPSLLFGAAAPLLCLLPMPGVSRRIGLTWAALTALWVPGFVYAEEARCYALLLCLSVGMTIAFARLLAQPDTRRATWWAVFAAATVATHYYAALLVALQALAYLGLCGRRALRTWPAALAFVPLAAWLGLHAPRIVELADPAIAWYSLLRPIHLLPLTTYLVGSFALVAMFALFAVAAIAARLRNKSAAGSLPTGACVAAITALIGAVTLIAAGFWRPSFTERYLIAFVPGVLLGIAVTADHFGRLWRSAPVVLVAAAAAGALPSAGNPAPFWKTYNFETASQALMAAGTKRLVFFWDHPANILENPAQLDIVGGFFFRRAGFDVAVHPIQPSRGEDPNPLLLAAADKPDTGILWLYDVHVHDTAAAAHPPAIATLDPAWSCRDFGKGPIGIVACTRRAP